MKRKSESVLFRISIFIISIFLSSCAQIVAPTGGEKDSKPPIVLKEHPENAKPKFSEKKITITFDEYVNLSSPEDQIVISPPLEEKPEYEISGKSLIVRFRKQPAPNTTYTINFGNAIVDNHEANALSDYRYVFSTGDVIDTFQLAGTIKLAENNSPQKNISICLYPTNDFNDSTIFLKKPAYFGKSKGGGNFRLYNLPQQTFQLIAFDDANKNLKYDKSEAIAFYDKTINTADSNGIINLSLYNPDTYEKERLIDTFSREQHKFTFLVYKPALKIPKPENDSKHYVWRSTGKDNIDSIFLFLDSTQTDSLPFSYDTSTFVLKTKKKSKLPAFFITASNKIELNDTFIVSFTTPVNTIDTSRITLKEDTIENPFSYQFNDDKSKFYINPIWKEKENTRFEVDIKDSAFTDIYGQYNKKSKTSFVTKNLKMYSNLKLTFDYKGENKNLFILLVSPDEKVIYKSFYIDTQKEFSFEYLLPAEYKIKIIDDANRNQRWDNGEYIIKKQPETVYYYPETFTLRAYWDLEQTIDLNTLIK